MLWGAPAVAIGEYICTPHVFLRHMRSAFCIDKAPGGRLGVVAGRWVQHLEWGSGAFAWLRADKHIETLNFYMNFRVLRGF